MGLPPDAIIVEWSEVQQHLGRLAAELKKSGLTDAIVGLTRGGLIPAVVLSHYTEDTPVIPVDYSSSKGKGDNVGSHVNHIPDIEAERLIVVDDICDTGHTMKEVVTILEGRNHEVTTFALHYKEGGAFEPDYHGVKLPANAPWIVFPWEV